jgi:hypothetical protein
MISRTVPVVAMILGTGCYLPQPEQLRGTSDITFGAQAPGEATISAQPLEGVVCWPPADDSQPPRVTFAVGPGRACVLHGAWSLTRSGGFARFAEHQPCMLTLNGAPTPLDVTYGNFEGSWGYDATTASTTLAMISGALAGTTTDGTPHYVSLRFTMNAAAAATETQCKAFDAK